MSKASTQNKLDQLLPSVQEWKKIVSPHTKPSAVKATWQVINSLGSYIALWIAMYFTLSISYWLTFAIALFAGAILVRVFIIFHDCGHGSFYKSRRAGNIIGFISGVFTFTPFSHWKWEHSVHHSASGDLDSPWYRRCLDHDGRRVPRFFPPDTLHLPRDEKSVYPLHDRPPLPFPHSGTLLHPPAQAHTAGSRSGK